MFLRHPLGLANLPNQLAAERLEYLTRVIRLNALTPFEETELVNGHLRLLLSLAQKWSIRSRHLADIFVADGLFAILTAIRKAPTTLREDKSITQYIVIHIISAFKKAVINQSCLKSPGADRKGDRAQVHNGKAYVKKKGAILKRHALPRETYHKGFNTESEAVAKGVASRIQSQLIVPTDRADLREIFELAPSNSQEKAILELRKFGYTMQETADMLATTRAKVSSALAKIEIRLRELLA